MHVVKDREAYRAWAEAQPRGRFERMAGEVVPMTPERVIHVQIKAQIWQAFVEAIDASRLEKLRAYIDGLSVEIGEDTDYEPDVLVNAGPFLPPNAVAATNPLIVAEVLSPGTQSIDTGDKLSGYFRVPAIQHYLIVATRRREVIHHRRSGAAIETHIISPITPGSVLHLDPPGIDLPLARIYEGTALAQS